MAEGSLYELGEFGFLERLRKLPPLAGRGVEIGIGDDCALVRASGRRQLLTTDALVEGVHFRRNWDSPRGLGRRAFAVNASDVAAMGGWPRFALLSLVVPKTSGAADLEAIVRGFAAAAREKKCTLVGGNLSAGSRWVISATLIGEPEKSVLARSGARVGDHVYVSGWLGSAALGREILLGRRRGARRETLAFRRPEARLEIGRMLARARLASAAIDVSDGLVIDLEHLCRASGVGASIEADRLPLRAALRRLAPKERLRLALTGGEDYEILFTVPPSKVPRLPGSVAKVPVTRIGTIVARRGVRVDGEGAERLATRGFDHFRR